VLSQLPRVTDPRLLVGTETADDAGVYQISDDLALVQTADLFPPVVDDAYAFGAIAAANALSDVYAMGGRPLTAMNLIGWPNGVIDFEVMGEVMKGAADKLAESGATLVGGHSWDDAEPKFGLSVTGLIDPRRIVTNAAAQPGDELVLTKPLGMGIITTAIKTGQVNQETVDRAVEIMATLNRDAADAMLEVGVHAATDVTGFGLLGHLREMVSGSGLAAEISASAVPIMDEARRLVGEDVAPGGTHRNLDSVRDFVSFGDLPASEQLLLADAQTSGGLLIAVEPAKLDRLLAALRARGTPVAARIGRLVAQPAGRIQVLP
jgi:selenide, water dikinase